MSFPTPVVRDACVLFLAISTLFSTVGSLLVQNLGTIFDLLVLPYVNQKSPEYRTTFPWNPSCAYTKLQQQCWVVIGIGRRKGHAQPLPGKACAFSGQKSRIGVSDRCQTGVGIVSSSPQPIARRLHPAILP